MLLACRQPGSKPMPGIMAVIFQIIIRKNTVKLNLELQTEALKYEWFYWNQTTF